MQPHTCAIEVVVAHHASQAPWKRSRHGAAVQGTCPTPCVCGGRHAPSSQTLTNTGLQPIPQSTVKHTPIVGTRVPAHKMIHASRRAHQSCAHTAGRQVASTYPTSATLRQQHAGTQDTVHTTAVETHTHTCAGGQTWLQSAQCTSSQRGVGE